MNLQTAKLLPQVKGKPPWGVLLQKINQRLSGVMHPDTTE